MGGQALLKYGIETRRVDGEEYCEILSFVKEVFPKGREIYYYRSKKNFGDCDYLVVNSFNNDIKNIIIKNFKPTKIHFNSGVYSFDYKNFQIDIITKPKEQLDIAQVYFSWNDLGNLMGRAYYKMGLKYGSQGLVFPIRQRLFQEVDEGSDHVIKELILSLNPREIFEFMGYDYDRWLKGFNTLEDIFIYTCSTPYFSAENFAFENLSHQNRTRNKKRPTFCAFLEWLNEHLEYDKKFQFGRKKDWIDFIDRIFVIKDEIEKARQKWLKGIELNKKFNGHKVIEWTGVTGESLGKLLRNYKDSKNNFNKFLEDNDAQIVKNDFLTFYQKNI